jgi:hypothetical protein
VRTRASRRQRARGAAREPGHRGPIVPTFRFPRSPSSVPTARAWAPPTSWRTACAFCSSYARPAVGSTPPRRRPAVGSTPPRRRPCAIFLCLRFASFARTAKPRARTMWSSRASARWKSAPLRRPRPRRVARKGSRASRDRAARRGHRRARTRARKLANVVRAVSSSAGASARTQRRRHRGVLRAPIVRPTRGADRAARPGHARHRASATPRDTCSARRPVPPVTPAR